MKGEYLLIIVLGLALLSLSNAQSQSCPLITIDDLGSTMEFSSNGLVARAIVPPGEASPNVPVRIRDFTLVCDAAGDQISTSSFVSVVVEFQCDFQSSTASLAVCSDPSTIVTRQYQFQCIKRNRQPVWDTIVSGSNLFIQTLNPTATLATPLADQCRRCIDDQQTMRADPTIHCDPCPAQCNRGQGRCYLGSQGDVCCNFYLQGNCTTDCLSALVADSNFNCVCPALTLASGSVSYSMPSGIERDVGSVATHTCNTGYRLEVNNAQAMENTRTCSASGWDGQDFTCERITCPDLTITNGVVTISPADQGFLSRTTYECNDGFALKGDGNRFCQMDSTWNGTDPECDILCPALTLANGVVSYSDVGSGIERDIGSVATHTCNSGFRLEVNNAQAVQNTRTCNTTGWDGQDFMCVKIMCPDLSITNGVVTISPADQGYLSRTTYECNEGFALKGDGNRVCQMDNSWNGTDPECADCSIALQDSNCAECGFDNRGMPICILCKPESGYTVEAGTCEKDDLRSGVSSHYLNGILLTIIATVLCAIAT